MFKENFENIDGGSNEGNKKEIDPKLESYAKDVVEKFIGIANGTYSKPEVVIRELIEWFAPIINSDQRFEVGRIAESKLKEKMDKLREQKNPFAEKIGRVMDDWWVEVFGIDVNNERFEDVEYKNMPKIEEIGEDISKAILSEDGNIKNLKFLPFFNQLREESKGRSRRGNVDFIDSLRKVVSVVEVKLMGSNLPKGKIEDAVIKLRDVVNGIEADEMGAHNN